MAQGEMKVNNFDLIWMFVLDSGRWIKKKEEIKDLAERMFDKLRVFEGVIRYYTPDEIEKHPKSKQRAYIYTKDEKYKEILSLYYDSDIDNVDPEYLENLQFFRAKLTGFDIVLKDKKVVPVEVRLLYHSSGIFTLEFWLKLKDIEFSPEIINEYQLIPHKGKKLSLHLSQKLLRDYSVIKPEWGDLLEDYNDEDEPVEVDLTFYRLVWLYWAIVAYIATNEEAKDSKSLRNLIRYSVYYSFPLLILDLPEVAGIEKLLENYKRELYAILTQEIYLKPEHLRLELIDSMFNFSNNLADRKDYALFFCLESSLQIYTQSSKSVQKYIAKKRNKSVEDQVVLEKLDTILVLELLHVQKLILYMFDYLLSKNPVSEMETDELAQMRGRLAKALEEFHNIKLMVKVISIQRCDRGRECFKIEKSVEALEEKLEYVDAAVSGIHNSLMEFLSILIGILVTIGPMIAIIFPDITWVTVCVALATLGIIIGIYFGYKWLFRWWYRKKKL